LFRLIKSHHKFLQLYQHDVNNFKENYLNPVILTSSVVLVLIIYNEQFVSKAVLVSCFFQE